ncbi:MAG TPA: MBL fold metallo-hydrolase [Bryobacteraceae bacterium]|nr:MBL fold metallo-hydrolase [Bryobacteraceae bacterium]
MQLTFWGAAQTVTGSMHELTVDGHHYLLDCGLYQGRRQDTFERNRHLPMRVNTLSGVVLSHAHIDHSGNLPSLARDGFRGEIHCTPATVDLCKSMLMDSAYLQQKDAEFLNKRYQRRHSIMKNAGHNAVEALYSVADAERILNQFRATGYHETKRLSEEVDFEFFDAGHLLGSASVLLNLKKGAKHVRLLFSGDVGRANLPILRDPEPPPEADYLILESTYGGRLHKKDEVVLDILRETIVRTASRGGRIIIPAFAVGRTQQIVLMLHQMCCDNSIPDIPIFVDSPLAINATEAYRAHPECFDEETNVYLGSGDDPFGFHRLRYVREASESKALNDLRGPMIVISASGMCEAGRILHHLRNNIEDPRNTIMIVGFQAEHTLGRKIVERHPEVPIFGEPMRLRAEVVSIQELSGHADQGELLAWIKPIAPRLKGIFLVHGELVNQQALQTAIEERYSVPVTIPRRGDHVSL